MDEGCYTDVVRLPVFVTESGDRLTLTGRWIRSSVGTGGIHVAQIILHSFRFGPFFFTLVHDQTPLLNHEGFDVMMQVEVAPVLFALLDHASPPVIPLEPIIGNGWLLT